MPTVSVHPAETATQRTLMGSAADQGQNRRLHPPESGPMAQPTDAEGHATVALDATGAQIARTLRWAPRSHVTGVVILEDVSAGQLADEWTKDGERGNGYWPRSWCRSSRRGEAGPDLLVGGQQQASLKQRLTWIGSEPRRAADSGNAVFATQPYEQLAKVYRLAGQDREARTVAIARRRDLRRYGNLTPYRWAVDCLLDKTIRYGYQTGRAVQGGPGGEGLEFTHVNSRLYRPASLRTQREPFSSLGSPGSVGEF